MRKFRDAYKDALIELPKFQLDADKLTNDFLKQKQLITARRRKTMLIASAASLLLVFGITTVTAMNDNCSLIKVLDNGFSFTKIRIQEDNAEAYDAKAYDNEPYDAKVPESTMVEGAPVNKMSSDSLQSGTEKESVVADVEELETKRLAEPKTYKSIKAFRDAENIQIAIPPLYWLGEKEDIVRYDINVIDYFGEDVRVMVSFKENKFFMMSQSDNRENPDVYIEKGYRGEAVNERIFTNDQGLNYTIIDSMVDGEVIATHAAISVNGRNISLSFFDFEIEIIEQVLRELDLSIYYIEE